MRLTLKEELHLKIERSRMKLKPLCRMAGFKTDADYRRIWRWFNLPDSNLDANDADQLSKFLEKATGKHGKSTKKTPQSM